MLALNFTLQLDLQIKTRPEYCAYIWFDDHLRREISNDHALLISTLFISIIDIYVGSEREIH